MIKDKEEESMFDHLSADDELGVVIRAAIYVEHQLDALIDELTVDGAAVKRLKLDYSGKGDLAIALGLHHRLRSPLTSLSNIRNDFAHKLDTVLSAERMKAFYKSFDGEDKEVIVATYAKARSRTHPHWPVSISDLTPLQQFQVLAVSLRQAVKAARLQVLKAQAAPSSA